MNGSTAVPITTTVPLGPAAVNLDFDASLGGTVGSAGVYVALAKSEIHTAGASVVTGDIAVSPAAATSLTGFSLVGDGNISGMTLAPGLYKWSTNVLVNSTLTLDGPANAVWIFQLAHGLTVADGIHVNLAGGAVAKNVFWQSFGDVTLGTTSSVPGIFLSQTSITLNTGATVVGRLLAQTMITLNDATVTAPAP